MLEYATKSSAYRALENLERNGTVERFIRDGKVYTRLIRAPITIPPKPEKVKEGELRFALDNAAALFRFTMLYGSQHFDSSERLRFMRVLNHFVQVMDTHIDFLLQLRAVVKNGASKAQYDEAVKELLKAGWLKTEYETYEKIEAVITMLGRDKQHPDYLGISSDTWMELIVHSIDELKLIDESS
jgi:hypothetical protein